MRIDRRGQIACAMIHRTILAHKHRSPHAHARQKEGCGYNSGCISQVGVAPCKQDGKTSPRITTNMVRFCTVPRKTETQDLHQE